MISISFGQPQLSPHKLVDMRKFSPGKEWAFDSHFNRSMPSNLSQNLPECRRKHEAVLATAPVCLRAPYPALEDVEIIARRLARETKDIQGLAGPDYASNEYNDFTLGQPVRPRS